MRVLTHNVYWFQGHPSLWGEERVAERPEVLRALGQFYASAEVEVLCLQEVHRSDLAQAIAQELGMTAWLHAPGGLRPDYGGVIMCRREAHLRDCTQVDGAPPHERIHLRAAIQWDGIQLELAMIHLPSNRFADSVDAGDAARIGELERMFAEQPRPNVIVGDMNSLPDSLPYRFMQDSGYTDAVGSMGDDATLEHRVDYVWIDNKYAHRLEAAAVLDHDLLRRTSPHDPTWQLSDHPPLLMELMP
jgi:endonuclease/exonuclease/phosphatase family metal-dependent hydrolase